MDIVELGKQYLCTAQQLKERVAALKEQYTRAPLSDLKQIESRINILYEEYLHLNHTGRQLLLYYSERGR